MSLAWLLILLVNSALGRTVSPQDEWMEEIPKGKLYVKYMHSLNFFNESDRNRYHTPVKWSATLKDRPDLPQWLHLLPSRYKQVAYLVGTPVTPAKELTIHIIVRNEDSFQHAEKYLHIKFRRNGNFSSSTRRIAELYINNFDTEDFFAYNTGRTVLEQLLQAVTSFCKDNATYIFNIEPAVTAPLEKLVTLSGTEKFGVVVQIGTQNKEFHSKVENLAKGIEINPQHCKRNGPHTHDFAPTFDVDWCKFRVKRLTELHSEVVKKRTQTTTAPATTEALVTATQNESLPTTGDDELSVTTRSRWDSFLMFPMLGVMCILFLILLSMIFFGRREGQYWRDYKTPKEQLEEYVHVREGQRHLRDLSMHRQLLEPYSDRGHSTTPLGIHSFLQPVQSNQNSVMNASQNEMQTSLISSTSKEEKDKEPPEHVAVGKQTVAEAAKACGSSLHMYRNPFENESNDDEEEEEEEADDDESESTNEEQPRKQVAHQ